MILAECGCTVEVGAFGGAECAVIGYVLEPGGDPHVTAAVDTAIVSQAFPSGAGLQVVGERVAVDGEDLEPRHVLSWSVTEDLERPGSWTLTVPVRRHWPTVEVNPLGDPVVLRGPLTIGSTVSIDGVYAGTSGEVRIPLLTNGRVHDQQRANGIDQLSGVDASGAYDRRKASLSIPAGHGLPRHSVIRRILNAAGVPSSALALSSMSPMFKPVDLGDEPAWSVCGELARVEGRSLRADRAGLIVNPEYALGSSADVDWTIRENGTLDGSSAFAPPSSDIVTGVTLTSERQVLRDDCERRTEIQVSEVFSIYAPAASTLKQTTGGTLTSLGGTTATATLRLTQRVVNLREYECDTLLSERVRTYAWFRRRAARYTLDGVAAADGPPTIGGYFEVFVDAGGTVDGSEDAYADGAETFQLISEIVTSRVFGDPATNGEGSYLVRTIVEEYGWGFRPAALKSRASHPGDPFDSIPWEADLPLLADLSGVSEGSELFGLRTRTITDFEVTEDGYLQGSTAETERVSVAVGSFALYADGSTGDAASHTLRTAETVTEVYSAIDDASHGLLRTSLSALDPGFRRIETETLQGYLPAAELREDSLPPASLFETDEEADAARAASRYEGQPIECTVIAEALEAVRQPNRITGSEPWAENEDELCSLAEMELKEGAVARLSWTMPACFLLQVGTRGRFVSYLDALDVYAVITQLRHSRDSADGPVLTQVTAKIYTI